MESASDDISVEDHAELDTAARYYLEHRMGMEGPSEDIHDLTLTLRALVESSGGLLAEEYGDFFVARDFIEQNPEIRTMLNAGWDSDAWKQIRTLNALRSYPRQEMKANVEAWNVPYYGPTAQMLRIYLDDMNRNRQQRGRHTIVAPIVQSSGMGKSRAADEVAKSIFTIPFNLRSATDRISFPGPDKAVRDLIRSKDDHLDAFQTRLLLFLIELFKAVQKTVDSMERQTKYEVFAASWRERLLEDRFRERLYTGAVMAVKEMIQNTSPEMEALYDVLVAATRNLLQSIASKSGGFNVTDCQRESNCKHDRVRLLIYFDEADGISEDILWYMNMYSTGEEKGEINAMDIFRRELQQLSRFDVCTLFLTTKAPVSLVKDNDDRYAMAKLQSPFTELPFDLCHGGKALAKENSHTLDEVCSMDFLVRFGRALWATRWNTATEVVKAKMIDFAQKKLGNGTALWKDDAMLAALSVRLGLEFDQRYKFGVVTTSRLVRNHMRVIFTIPDHKEYMYTGAPSEPILAEAAGRIMYVSDYNTTVRSLPSEMKRSGIEKGKRGELVARLLLTLAHDQAIRTGQEPISHFSQKIPVVRFLEALFTPQYKDAIQRCRPQNVASDITLEKTFENAFVHFTHFTQASTDVMLSDETILWAMVRGMAFQCRDKDRMVDICIPISMWDKELQRYEMSVLAIQIKQRPEEDFVPFKTLDLEAPEMEFFSPSDDKRANARPYIVLIMEFDTEQLKPRTQADSHSDEYDDETAKKENQSHPRYVLKATGCSSNVYNVIEPREKATYAELLGPHTFPTHPARCGRNHPVWTRGEASFSWAKPSPGESSLADDIKYDVVEAEEGVAPVMD